MLLKGKRDNDELIEIEEKTSDELIQNIERTISDGRFYDK